MHAHEVHAYEMDAYEVHAYETPTYKMHARKMHSCEMHILKMPAHEIPRDARPCVIQASVGAEVVKSLNRQATLNQPLTDTSILASALRS